MIPRESSDQIFVKLHKRSQILMLISLFAIHLMATSSACLAAQSLTSIEAKSFLHGWAGAQKLGDWNGAQLVQAISKAVPGERPVSDPQNPFEPASSYPALAEGRSGNRSLEIRFSNPNSPAEPGTAPASGEIND